MAIFIVTENKNAMARVVNMLIDKGCHNIGLLTLTPNIFSLKERIEGYQMALTGRNMPTNDVLVRTVDHKRLKESTREELDVLIKIDADALVFTNNLVASEAIWYLNTSHAHLVKPLKMATFDNLDLFDYVQPRVISLAQPVDEMAQKITEILLANINEKSAIKQHIVLNPKIIKRT
ncbi:MAG: LacI family transcriptional regulator [Bacteroidales bacterium]|nr:LacI family transcriptional regulator [Bacteroidales bacterium]